MDLTTLRYFVTTAEELHVTNAAKKLYTSQQSLSEHIRKLEKHYGVTLFQRKPTFKLTPAGECVQRYAIQMLELERQMMSELSDTAENISVKIVIGLSRNRARLFFVEAWREFRQLYPNVDIEVIEDSADALYKMLLTGRIDVYIGLEHFFNRQIIKYPLKQENFYFIISKTLFQQYYKEEAPLFFQEFSQNLDLSHLKDFPFLMFRRGNYFRTILDRAFAEIKFKPNIVFESNDHEIIYSLCASGMGAGFISQFYLPRMHAHRPDYADEVYTFQLRQPEFITNVVLATRSNYRVPTYAKHFFEIVQKNYQKFSEIN